jgi:hypothetical protein
MFVRCSDLASFHKNKETCPAPRSLPRPNCLTSRTPTASSPSSRHVPLFTTIKQPRPIHANPWPTGATPEATKNKDRPKKVGGRLQILLLPETHVDLKAKGHLLFSRFNQYWNESIYLSKTPRYQISLIPFSLFFLYISCLETRRRL